MPFPRDIDYVDIVGSSANEHTVINSFFKLSDSASTVHLLQTAQKAFLAGTGQAPPFLTPDNYASLGNTPYTATENGTSVTHPLSTWAAGEWSAIQSTLDPNINHGASPYAWAYVTPGDVTCANGSFTGMAFLIGNGISGVSALINFNQQQGLSNGGTGAPLQVPYGITTATTGASSPANWQLTQSGNQYQFVSIAGTSANPYFLTGTVASNSFSATYSQIVTSAYTEGSYYSGYNNTVNQQLGFTTSNSTPAGQATQLQQNGNTGFLGNREVFHASKLYSLVSDRALS